MSERGPTNHGPSSAFSVNEKGETTFFGTPLSQVTGEKGLQGPYMGPDEKKDMLK